VKKFWSKYKAEIIIFGGALVVQLLALIFILWREGQIGGLFVGYHYPLFPKDPSEYLKLGQNVLRFGQFSLSDQSPFLPDSFRTPVYPVFLAGIAQVFGSLLAVSFIQDVLVALSAVLVYRLGKKFFSGAVGWLAAGLFVFEPTNLFFANTIATEPLFVFLLWLALYLFLEPAEKALSRWRIFISGLVLGLAALTRPVGQFLPLLFLLWLFWVWRPIGAKKIILAGLVFLSGFVAVIFPWSLRNKLTFDSWQISSAGTISVYGYFVPMFLAQKYNQNQDLLSQELWARFDFLDNFEYESRSLANASEINQTAREFILQDPVGFGKFYFIKTAPFFLTDGIRDYARYLKYVDLPDHNLTDLLLKGKIKEMARLAFSGNLEFNLFLLGFVLWFLAAVFMAGAVVWMFFSGHRARWLGLFFILLTAYFALVSGPVSNSRYRIPVAPAMMLLASAGAIKFLAYLRSKIKKKDYGDNRFSPSA